jgi:hypothetical protein
VAQELCEVCIHLTSMMVLVYSDRVTRRVRFTNTNLETQDVLKVPGCPYVFVHEAHPVINLLRMNKHLLGVDIDTTEKMDGQWYKITAPLMESSCETLRTKILSKIETKVSLLFCPSQFLSCLLAISDL